MREEGAVCKEARREVWDDGAVLCLNCSGGYMAVYACQNSKLYTLNGCVLPDVIA